MMDEVVHKALADLLFGCQLYPLATLGVEDFVKACRFVAAQTKGTGGQIHLIHGGKDINIFRNYQIMAKKEGDFASIRNDIREGNIAPFYVLHGEESYFIDQLTEELLTHVLSDEEKDFNLTQFYGADVTNLGDVVAACRRYPMMADRQMVMLRDVQALDQRKGDCKLEKLELYAEKPLDSTVFVITSKGKKLDGRSKLLKLVQDQGGVVYESKRYRDYELTKVLPAILEDTGLTYDAAAIQLLIDYIGSDFSRLMAEIEKMKVNMPQGEHKVTKEMVANNIGISKDFNNFELVAAVAVRDFKKMEMIRRHFAANPKANPIQMTMAVLFNFFSNIMLGHYAPQKDPNGLMAALKLNFPQAKDLFAAMKVYNAWKAMENIALIREYDARLKGARNTASLPDDEALKELLYKLTH